MRKPACGSVLFCSRLCPSTAGSSPLPESSNFLCPLLSLSIPPPDVISPTTFWTSDWSYTLYLPLCASNSPPIVFHWGDVSSPFPFRVGYMMDYVCQCGCLVVVLATENLLCRGFHVERWWWGQPCKVTVAGVKWQDYFSPVTAILTVWQGHSIPPPVFTLTGLLLSDKVATGLHLTDKVATGLHLSDKVATGLHLSDKVATGLLLSDKVQKHIGHGNRSAPQWQSGNRPAPQWQSGNRPAPQWQSGNRLTPQWQSGNRLTPQWESGNRPAPQWESGNRLTPQWESGNRPAPQWESGNRPAPQWESGNRPAPQWQSGNRPAPQWESGNRPAPQWESGNRPAPQWQSAETHWAWQQACLEQLAVPWCWQCAGNSERRLWVCCLSDCYTPTVWSPWCHCMWNGPALCDFYGI